MNYILARRWGTEEGIRYWQGDSWGMENGDVNLAFVFFKPSEIITAIRNQMRKWGDSGRDDYMVFEVEIAGAAPEPVKPKAKLVLGRQV